MSTRVAPTFIAAVLAVIGLAPAATPGGSVSSSFTYSSSSYGVVYRHGGVSPTITSMRVAGFLLRTDERTGGGGGAVVDGIARCSRGVCTFRMTWSHGPEHASYYSHASFADGAYGERTDDCRAFLSFARCNFSVPQA
jgi:hypothetical protein